MVQRQIDSLKAFASCTADCARWALYLTRRRPGCTTVTRPLATQYPRLPAHCAQCKDASVELPEYSHWHPQNALLSCTSGGREIERLA